MAILISDAEGSRDLKKAISNRPGHPEVELCSLAEMPFGDALIAFNGPPVEDPMVVGVEIKKLGDLLNCIQTGRFSGGQLIGCTDVYDFSILLIEGEWRMNHQTGILETLRKDRGQFGWWPVSTGPRKWMYRELSRWLMVMTIVAGVAIWRTRDREETVQTLIDIHDLGRKKWTDHKSVRAMSNVTVEQLKYREMPDGTKRMRFEKPSLLERMLVQFDGLGVDRTLEATKHFKSVRRMGERWLNEKEWRGIKGVGKKIASGIVKEIEKEVA